MNNDIIEVQGLPKPLAYFKELEILITRLIIDNTNGTQEIIEVEASHMAIEADGMYIAVVAPRDTPMGFIAGSVDVKFRLNELAPTAVPEVTLTAGMHDGESFTSLASAMMYVTNNGRLMARNQTLGFANNEKPIATQLWRKEAK